MGVENIIKWGAKKPRKLFVVDASGATLSAVLLGVVLVKLEHLFGIPRQTLYLLALFPCLFALYDFYCILKEKFSTGAFLQGIALLNLFYSFLSLGLCLCHTEVITPLGWTYIVLEISIVTTLAHVEYRVGKALNS